MRAWCLGSNIQIYIAPDPRNSGRLLAPKGDELTAQAIHLTRFFPPDTKKKFRKFNQSH